MVAPNPPDDDLLTSVRAALPALDAGIYLNTGSVGPLPAESAAAIADIEAYELGTGRAHPDYWTETLQRMNEARAAVAAVLTTDVSDIALTHSATDGMNLAAWSLDWRPGDRAVTTSLEHPGGIGGLYNLRDRLGIDLAFVDVGPERSEAGLLDAFDAAIDESTRLVAISHVLWASGTVLPIARIAEMAHDRGAIVAIDGAQAAGALPVDVASTGADLYAISAQKWLLGPEGMGAVAITEAGRERLSPSWGGHLTFESFASTGAVVRWPDARRFESSTFHRPSIVGMARSIGWLSMFVGLDWVYERGASMTRLAADRLAGIDGVEVVTPRDRMSNLVAFRIAGWEPEAALAELSSRVFAIARTVPLIDALRISVACFTTEAELERFAGAVELLAAHTPTTIPERRTLTILSGG